MKNDYNIVYKTIHDNLVMLFLVISYCIFGDNKAIQILILSLIVLYFIFSSTVQNLRNIFFLLPLSVAISINQNGLSAVTILQLILIFKLIYIDKRILLSYLICLIGLMSCQLITILFFKTSPRDIISLWLDMVSLMILYNHFSSLNSQSLSPLQLKLSFAFGVTVSGLLSVIFSLSSLMSYYLLGYIIRFSGLWNNANYYGQQVNLAIAIILGSYFKREIKPNLLDICILGALVLLGIMTLSRSFLYVFLFMSIFYFIAIIKSLNNMRLGNRIAIVLVLLLFIIMTCSLAFNSISSRRGLVSSNEDILAGRLTNSNIIIDRFISYNDPILILFGFGAMNSYKYINTLEATDILNTHNTYFDLLTDFGIVGLIFVSAIFIKYFSNIRGFKILDGDNLYLLVILISAFVMSYLLTDYIYYLLALCGFYRNDQESVMQNSRIVATKA